MSIKQFMCGSQTIDIKNKYTYLGVTLDEHLTFLPCIDSRALAGSRAFSSIINKYNINYIKTTLCLLKLTWH